MDSTALDLLTRDGTVTVVFTPALEHEHYPELHRIVGECDTAEELRTAVRTAAASWQREVLFG